MAADAYRRRGFISARTMRWSLVAGIPATIAGAVATNWIDGRMLVSATEVILAGIGARLLLVPSDVESGNESAEPPSAIRLVIVGGMVGFLAGLLANSGGFLLAPLYIAVAKLSIKQSLGASLAVAAVLAVPGTIVHASLGHINWAVAAVLAITSIPASRTGATVALRMDSHHLERLYGAALLFLGVGLLFVG